MMKARLIWCITVDPQASIGSGQHQILQGGCFQEGAGRHYKSPYWGNKPLTVIYNEMIHRRCFLAKAGIEYDAAT